MTEYEDVTVAVPFRHSGCKHRFESFKFISDLITDWLPGAEYVLVDAGGEKFDRSKTRNLAVRQARGSVVVLHDADTFATKENLLAAVEKARVYGGLVLPYNYYGGLSQKDSETLIKNPDKKPRSFKPEEVNFESIGGIWVIDKLAWWRAGGMDERFRGWGYEDNAFYVASETMNDPTIRIKGDIFHLWHPRPPNFTQTPEYFFNRDMYLRYKEAEGDVCKMLGIFEEQGRHG